MENKYRARDALSLEGFFIPLRTLPQGSKGLEKELYPFLNKSDVFENCPVLDALVPGRSG